MVWTLLIAWSVNVLAYTIYTFHVFAICQFQLMIDELYLTEKDLNMIKRGETPEAVYSLGRLRERFRAVWVVTSTSCLLDMTSDIDDSDDSDDKVDLGPVMSGAGYQTVGWLKSKKLLF